MELSNDDKSTYSFYHNLRANCSQWSIVVSEVFKDYFKTECASTISLQKTLIGLDLKQNVWHGRVYLKLSPFNLCKQYTVIMSSSMTYFISWYLFLTQMWLITKGLRLLHIRIKHLACWCVVILSRQRKIVPSQATNVPSWYCLQLLHSC